MIIGACVYLTIVYLYKKAINMRLGAVRLQGLIAQQIKACSREASSQYPLAPHTKRTERKHPHLNGL
jgi:hypothetical protein